MMLIFIKPKSRPRTTNQRTFQINSNNNDTELLAHVCCFCFSRVICKFQKRTIRQSVLCPSELFLNVFYFLTHFSSNNVLLAQLGLSSKLWSRLLIGLPTLVYLWSRLLTGLPTQVNVWSRLLTGLPTQVNVWSSLLTGLPTQANVWSRLLTGLPTPVNLWSRLLTGLPTLVNPWIWTFFYLCSKGPFKPSFIESL